MTEYTKVLIESDRRGRIQISCQNAKGYGHGYRLAGPKYLGDDTEPLATRELDERDVAEIRSYLAIWDQIHGKTTDATQQAAQQREERAVAEARPHDDEPGDLGANTQLDPEAERVLRLHLASMHANASAFTLPAAELDDVHRHDHFGPCGLRNHDFADRSYDEAKARAVVAELEDGDRG